MGHADSGDRGDGRGEPLQAQLLLDPKTIRNDLKLIEKAVEERWPISPRKLKGIIERLYHIVETEQVVIPVKDGAFESELEANKVAVTAARVLVTIEAQNQADRHLLIKAEMAEASPPRTGDTYIIGQQVKDVRKLLAADPEYVEFLRQRAAREDGYASTAG